MTTAILPKFLQPYQCEDLIRLGNDHDGGYLVCRKDVEAADMIVNFGVCADWSFERDFMAQNDVPLYAYDASTTYFLFLKIWIKNSIKLVIGWMPLKIYFRDLLMMFTYRRFFVGDKKHIRKFVGAADKGDYASFTSITKNFSNKVFLKIDIEGGEYPILDDIIDAADHLTALVIEFHDCEQHIEMLEDFINRFPLALVHTHANNYAQITNKLPPVFELTFSRNGAGQSKSDNLPHPLDMPNDTRHPEMILKF